MALTQSTMMTLGSPAPDFDLPSTDEKRVCLEDYAGAEALVVLFICNHCPYVIHIADALAEVGREYMKKNIAFVAINSNDVTAYPDDSFEKMQEEAKNRGYPFAYLLDENQAVAKAYAAACTPDIYVFDKQRALVYRGQFDDTRPERISSGNYNSAKSPAHGADLKRALDQLLEGQTPDTDQVPSMGCNIKWKPGNEPEYFG